MKLDANSLPNEPEQLKRMLLELQQVVAEKDKVISELHTKYQTILERYNEKVAQAYGKSSEQMAGAGETFNEAEDILDERDEAELATSLSEARAKAKPKRTSLPADLPRDEVIVDIDDGNKVCDCCGHALHKVGETCSEKLEFVPAHIKVIKTIRPSYACKGCEQKGINTPFKIAPMPATPIPKGVATASLLSQIITAKYQFGLPLYRQQSWFNDCDIDLSRQTMSDWMVRCSELLLPLYQKLKTELLSQYVIHADETPLKVINAEKATSYMWVYCCGVDSPGSNTNIVLFDYHNSRAGQCAVDFLEGYDKYMMVDGYKGYDKTNAILIACLTHIRRKFIEAKRAQGKKKIGKADVALSKINKLYGIETSIKDKTSEDKYRERLSRAKPIVDDLRQWLEAHQDKVPPKKQIG